MLCETNSRVNNSQNHCLIYNAWHCASPQFLCSAAQDRLHEPISTSTLTMRFLHLCAFLSTSPISFSNLRWFTSARGNSVAVCRSGLAFLLWLVLVLLVGELLQFTYGYKVWRMVSKTDAFLYWQSSIQYPLITSPFCRVLWHGLD